jgi:hypothetical protein
MIDVILIVISVMFGTLLYDKHKRQKFIIKEGFDNSSKMYTPSYSEFMKDYARVGLAGYNPGAPSKLGAFNVYSTNSDMETFQSIDYDNNIASIYGYKADGYDTTPKTTITTCTSNDGLMGSNRWCGCEALSSNGTMETATRRLIGGVNPRTLIAPKIIPPITDMEEWGTDNYNIHSAINDYRSDDLYLSGYKSFVDCLCQGTCNCKQTQTHHTIKEGFNSNINQVVADHNYLSPYDVSEQRLSRPQILQNRGISSIPEQSMYTSITNSEDLLFIEQERKKRETNDSSSYTIDYITGDEPGMIYDPRMVGYSDSRRGYVDKLLGQPKFYYDDINAARGPNYITRNKIDIYSFGESTGRLRDPRDSSTCGNNNQLAVEEFHNSTLQHRSDLMQSLMNKRNGEMWQLKEFPINTNGQRMLGGTSKL